MQRGLGGFHGAYKVRTQVPHTAPPHERLHQDNDICINENDIDLPIDLPLTPALVFPFLSLNYIITS
ncbi:MAG: hypothetical protein F6J98_11395 [Moorea sp. SIO4G2]|uniref:hypothetical protein n=1 Tax=unclassified Moorena TaxID=2683338 RepID=UPI0013F9CD21|nr:MULTISPECIES: hypothetical protein [unclassified Moorena]NEO11307.1 hypothetical protein [Moorena sp. SIO3E8]NEO49628.1 hypothetical protein [Moorena sp. SIO4A3]NEO61008.1 hypothetical protein [Moorena sp. SIO4G2]NEP97859.1 hypothetical protein [Moorena sp. SIO3F7]